MKYRKKPVVIEAMKFDGTYQNADAIQSWACRDGNTLVMLGNFCPDRNSCALLDIATLEGTMQAKPGDWIIRGIKGEFYPCKPDIFEATYEKETQVSNWPCGGGTHYMGCDCHEASREAKIAELESNLEYERMRLAACGVAALSNTEESAKNQRLDRDNPYWSASYGDVLQAVEREMKLRAERDQLQDEVAHRDAQLAGLQRDYDRVRELSQRRGLALNEAEEVLKLGLAWQNGRCDGQAFRRAVQKVLAGKEE